jgi:NAD(P)-dependent dehydrogenase (short-subunit alcohol dehydrogenase family)
MDFTNKVVVISGATTGIGRSTYDLLVSLGAKVYNLDTNLEDSPENSINCDVSVLQEVKSSIKKIIEIEKTIHCLFTNAGIHQSGSILDTEIEDYHKIININLFGTIHLLKEILPVMKKNSKGKIVLMGSDQALVGKSESSAYGVSKGAIAQLTKSTAIDFAEFNIHVNCICPGTIDTPLYHKAVDRVSKSQDVKKEDLYQYLRTAQPIQNIGNPKDVAEFVAFLLSEKSNFITGSLQSIDGGYCAQ